MFVKVCGIRCRQDIDEAARLGYSAVGVVLHAGSKRYCSPDQARELARYARGQVIPVAVGVSWDEVAMVAADFDLVQVYGPAPVEPHRLICAGETEPDTGDTCRYFLYDRSRGSGEREEFPEWLHRYRDRLLIAGGLAPGNVGEVIARYRPRGVDVSSGVENENGEKDYGRMNEFIREVRGAIANGFLR